MPKSKIRPPRTPRGESARVTIGNQARQIRNLTGRCVDLVDSRDKTLNLLHSSNEERDRIGIELAQEKSFRTADLRRLSEDRATILRLQTHIEGYRMALADFMQPERIPRIG